MRGLDAERRAGRSTADKLARADAALGLVDTTPPPEPSVKPSETRVTRVGYTLTDKDLETLEALELRADKLAKHRTKSELVRAALQHLAETGREQFEEAIDNVELIRTRKRREKG